MSSELLLLNLNTFLSDMYYLLGNTCLLVLVNEKVDKLLLSLTSSAAVLMSSEIVQEHRCICLHLLCRDDRVSIALLFFNTN